MSDYGPTSATVPQLRTLLLTDLCDSTRVIERLGDVRAAELFREHDRLVLQLQQRWRGRLIDRSDGLLLLFERPIDGLGFALDYERGLCELGAERQVVLTARAGLHVGEVLTWRNSDEAVRVGAKPLEVEGIAKPLAARLMAMARPGQILLSALAEPLAYRAARELGERGECLVWKHHGRWVFKGMPGTQDVFEVGEPGIAPLRAPQNSAKAWRAIPLWRRPRMLAAEFALLACIAAGTWFALRPQPAIAFGERDWVVVGDLRNLTGQTVLDDSLEQALRISLEQSRYVNVLSDLKARDTLARMRRKPDTALDRETASGIALREGARAVILPTVAEVGGRLRVSVELVDPNTQTTVHVEKADGRGTASLLGSIDTVTAALRETLGEAMTSIERDSAPLPEVTTGSLDALRAFALAEQAYANTRYREALQLYRRATQVDPKFALAWVGQMRAFYAQERAPAGVAALRRAQALRTHLPPREALYLDAWAAEFDTPALATDRWVELARLYPDYLAAQANAALWLYRENRFAAALVHARAADSSRGAFVGDASDTIGRVQLGLERYADAETAFRHSHHHNGASLRRLVAAAAARRDFSRAHEYERGLEPDNAFAYIERTSLAVDQKRWSDARSLARMALKVRGRDYGAEGRYLLVPLAVTEWLAGCPARAREHVRSAIRQSLAALAQDFNADAETDAAAALAAALLAQRLGDHASTPAVLEALRTHDALMRKPALAELATVARAGQARHAGRPQRAVRLLEPLLTGRERYQTRVALMDAQAAAGNAAEALVHARWLQRRRGLAYIELDCGHCLQALNVADSNRAVQREAELLRKLGPEPETAANPGAMRQRGPTAPVQARSRADTGAGRVASSPGAA